VRGKVAMPTAPETPVSPPPSGAYADPPAPAHGQPFWAIAHSGSRWRQYPSGYYDGGFLEATDGWVIPGGMRAILLDNGGRDCGGAKLLHIIVKKISDAPTSFAKGDGGQVVPDRTEWRFIIEGGFELVMTHSHVGDSTYGNATVIDHVRNVRASINPNGQGKTVNGKLIRVPHTYRDKAGKEWPTSSRYPYWRHWEPGGNQWTKPLRAPTLVNYP